MMWHWVRGEEVMFSFVDGFYKDFVVLLILTILLGTVFSAGIAWALDAYFGDSLNEMIGEYGQYDIILHIKKDAKSSLS